MFYLVTPKGLCELDEEDVDEGKAYMVERRSWGGFLLGPKYEILEWIVRWIGRETMWNEEEYRSFVRFEGQELECVSFDFRTRDPTLWRHREERRVAEFTFGSNFLFPLDLDFAYTIPNPPKTMHDYNDQMFMLHIVPSECVHGPIYQGSLQGPEIAVSKLPEDIVEKLWECPDVGIIPEYLRLHFLQRLLKLRLVNKRLRDRVDKQVLRYLDKLNHMLISVRLNPEVDRLLETKTQWARLMVAPALVAYSSNELERPGTRLSLLSLVWRA